MDNLEYNIPDLDMSIVKSNIKKAMIEKGIKQVDLVKALSPLQQPDVSKCLNPKEPKRNFTVEQLYKIACFLNVSLDDLFGMSLTKKYNNEVSLSDACEALCQFSEIVHPNFQEVEINEKKYICLYSDRDEISKLFSSFSDASKFDKKVFEAWKTVFIEENQDKLRKFNFKRKEDLATEWINFWISKTLKQTELYRITSNEWQRSELYEKLFAACEGCYFHIQDKSKTANLMYEYIDDFIEKKQLSHSCSEYISLMIFKKIHEREENPIK